VIRYYYIQANRDKYPIAKMVRWSKVSRSGFYAWLRRKPSLRDKTNADLLQQIQKIHDENHRTYGSTRITRELRDNGYLVNHKRVERIMRENSLRAKARRKFKATTYSDHDLPVNENLLDRDFTADPPGKKMVSDITYIPTDEGWLYLSGVMDLCGRKMVGVAMGSRMTKQLVMDALQDAVNHTNHVEGCILHSDRGSQVRQEVA
jgi:putative transposase